jgi:hypothetical protein
LIAAAELVSEQATPQPVVNLVVPSAYVSVQCLACRQFHHVNPITGKVLGGDNDEQAGAWDL